MRIHLKLLTPADVSQNYIDWFNDNDVVNYSDNQFRIFTLASQKIYVASILQDNNVDLFGIFDDKLHIGNITISGLNSPHKRAELSYVIGDRSYWGKGIASKVISDLCFKSKTEYKLNKLYAGCAEKNEGSKKALIKNGFSLEGKRKSHLFYNGEWMDQLDFGLLL